MLFARLVVTACCVGTVGCAGSIVRPSLAPGKPASEALLVLPGFGYNRGGEQAFRALGPALAADGLDLYLPDFVSRAGLGESRERLRRFIVDNRLSRYRRVHVFAFIAGGWTFNPLADAEILPNLATVVYDRSPYQERAPRIALEKLRILTWLKYGSVVFDVARTEYAPLDAGGVRVGLMVETVPTALIRRYAASASRQGPYHFECGAFQQRYDDCLYVAMSHGELYGRFAEVWPDVRSFIQTGRFTPAADRTLPAGDGAIRGRQRSLPEELR